MKFWFTSGPAVAPARSGTGLTSTYAADRAEALAAQRTAAAADLEKRTREINAQLEKAKELSAQSIAAAEAEAEATRKRVGEDIVAEFYGTTGELVRAHLTEPTRAAAQKLRDAFLRFRERSLVEMGVTQGTEYVGLAIASVLVAESPASVMAFGGPDMTGDFLGMANRAVNDPFEWDHAIEQIERRMVARMTDFAGRRYEATDYQRDYFQALKWSPTMGDRLHAIAAVERENEERRRAAFVANYVAPPVHRRAGHAAELTG